MKMWKIKFQSKTYSKYLLILMNLTAIKFGGDERNVNALKEKTPEIMK